MNVLINAHGYASRRKIGNLGSDVLHWYSKLGSCEMSDPQTLNIDLESYNYTETAGNKPSEFPYDHFLGFSATGDQASLLDDISAFGAYYAGEDGYTKIPLPQEGKLSDIIKIIKNHAFETRNYSGPIHFYISACREFPEGNGIKTKTKRRKNVKRKTKRNSKHRKTNTKTNK